GDADVKLERHNVMHSREPSYPGKWCLGFVPTDTNIAIFGNSQQQGIRVVFDLSISAIGFVPNSC
ncbi:hypothetical protein MKX01_000002, partial [Papaver californicum]